MEANNTVAVAAPVVAAPEPAPPKKCQLDQVLVPALIEILKLSPQNPVVRTQVHAALLIPLPDEVQEFDAIQAWIEANITPRPAMAASVLLAAATNNTAFTIRVEGEELELGTCTYTCRRVGSRNHRFSRGDIEEFASDVDTLEDLVENLRESATEDMPDTDVDNDGYEHNNHESTRYEDSSVTLNRDDLRRQVVAFLSAWEPDELRRLGGTPIAQPAPPIPPAPRRAVIEEPALTTLTEDIFDEDPDDE